MTKITIVVPIYNEAKILENNILKIRDAASTITPNFEIVIAEDGSTDGSDKITASLASRYKEIKYFHSDKRLGKGEALKRAFQAFNSDIFIFLDADLSADLKYLPNLVSKIENGCDIAIGSRMTKGSNVERSLKREIASRTYNWLVRRFFNVNFADMQCGFKAFKKDAILNVIGDVEETHWFFDTETLIRAHKAGYKISEIPIAWKEMSNSTKVKILRDGKYMFSKLVKLWWKLKTEKK